MDGEPAAQKQLYGLEAGKGARDDQRGVGHPVGGELDVEQNAPGHTGAAPGHDATGSGNSESAPGHTGAAPGQSGQSQGRGRGRGR